MYIVKVATRASIVWTTWQGGLTAYAGRLERILLMILLLMMQSFAVEGSEGKAYVTVTQWRSTPSAHVLALEEGSSDIVGSNSHSAIFNHETALNNACGLAGLHIAAFQGRAWMSDTRAACRVSAGFFSSHFMMVLSYTKVRATQFVPKKSTKCVAKKAEVSRTFKRCMTEQGTGKSRRAMVTVGKQRGTATQGLSETMQGVSMDIIKAHQDKDSRFQATTTSSSWFLVPSWFLVLAAICSVCYIYIHTYIYIYICINIHIYIYIYTYINI